MRAASMGDRLVASDIQVSRGGVLPLSPRLNGLELMLVARSLGRVEAQAQVRLVKRLPVNAYCVLLQPLRHIRSASRQTSRGRSGGRHLDQSICIAVGPLGSANTGMLS